MNGNTIVVICIVVAVLLLLRQMGSAKPEEAKALLKKGARVIDVRSAGEFASGHLKSAINIPLGELADRIAKEAPDKETPILLHCASGARSGAGQKVLTGMGYRTVLNLGSYNRALSIVGE